MSENYIQMDLEFSSADIQRSRYVIKEMGDHCSVLSDNAMNIVSTIENIWNSDFSDRSIKYQIIAHRKLLMVVVKATDVFLTNMKKFQTAYDEFRHNVSFPLVSIFHWLNETPFGVLMPFWLNDHITHDNTIRWFANKKTMNKATKKVLDGIENAMFDENGYPQCPGNYRFMSMFYFTAIGVINNPHFIHIEWTRYAKVLNYILLLTINLSIKLVNKLHQFNFCLNAWITLMDEAIENCFDYKFADNKKDEKKDEQKDEQKD